jgi:putative membrane-bound dehydrogenase-like protein
VAPNILAPRLQGAEADRRDEYTRGVSKLVADSIRQAIARARPGKLKLGRSEAHFAANRRVLRDGKCVAMGPFAEGKTDPTVMILAAYDEQDHLLGLLFNYACHATTLPGSHNRVGGDWPGLAAAALEETLTGCVAVPLIGCGADTNPEPRGEKQMAVAHGQAMTRAVMEGLQKELRPVSDGAFSSIYGLVGLPFQRPTPVELTARLLSSNPFIKQNAQDMLAILEHKDRIPETYPAPVQVMRFGDDLMMVFLGGEVVGDYVFRLRQELREQIASDRLWVTAYANDVFGYLASERMIKEGGYEYDYSMVFYNQPGPWASGTEEAVIGRVHDLVERPSQEGNLGPDESLRSIRVAEGLEVELVASEPLLMDPVNIAFGPDGKLWVAEMSDYPQGADGQGSPGGRVRYLEDTDQDGRFDKSTLFLEGLRYTTGVEPFGKGVLVSSTPEVFYVEIDPQTGRAGKRTTLLDGFGDGNPQHVVNGFAVGIDNWVYVNGDKTGDIRSLATGKVVPMSGRDGRFKPRTGELETECGMTQHLRSRDDVGHWFGGANYCPFWHYLLEERYLARNPHVPAPRPWKDIYGSYYPAVYPASRITGKFNDLFTANRFTSACSPMPYRDQRLGDGSKETMFACEPVHNLVHRARLVPEGLSFRAERFPADEHSEFFASTDPWCRPVRVITGPDGAVWVADMYRQVIEHPEWIPDAWLDRLDVRAGRDKGRIYRVYPAGQRPTGEAIPRLANLSSAELVKLLGYDNGWHRDTAQRLLIERQAKELIPAIEQGVSSPRGLEAIHSLGTLEGLGGLRPEVLRQALRHPEPDVRIWGLRLAEGFLPGEEELTRGVLQQASDGDERVRFQAAFSLGYLGTPESARVLGRLAATVGDDPWWRTAVLSSASKEPITILETVLSNSAEDQDRGALIDGLLATAVGQLGKAAIDRLLLAILPGVDQPVEPWQQRALSSVMDALDRQNSSLIRWSQELPAGTFSSRDRLVRVLSQSREESADQSLAPSRRAAAVLVLGRGLDQVAEDKNRLAGLLSPTVPGEVQLAAAHALEKLRSDDVVDLLLGEWSSHGPLLRSKVISILLGRPAWASRLLDGVEGGRVARVDVGAAAIAELLHHPHQSVAERAKTLFENSSSSRKEVLDQYAGVLTMAGDATAGQSVFEKHCAGCHRFGQVGQLVGPDLGGVRDRSPGYLLGAVLDPNRAVESKYVSYSVELADGRVLLGMLVVESSSSMTLARPDGTLVEILRGDIERMVSSGRSFMPEGLEKDLSAQQLADLFAFLAQSPDPSATPSPKSVGP